MSLDHVNVYVTMLLHLSMTQFIVSVYTFDFWNLNRIFLTSDNSSAEGEIEKESN